MQTEVNGKKQTHMGTCTVGTNIERTIINEIGNYSYKTMLLNYIITNYLD